jgi:hypothetical protein
VRFKLQYPTAKIAANTPVKIRTISVRDSPPLFKLEVAFYLPEPLGQSLLICAEVTGSILHAITGSRETLPGPVRWHAYLWHGIRRGCKRALVLGELGPNAAIQIFLH